MSSRLAGIRLCDGGTQNQDVSLAVADLLEQSSFCPAKAKEAGVRGPFYLDISRVEGRLLFAITTEDNPEPLHVLLSLTPFRRVIQDYCGILRSYQLALRDHPAKIEAIDMARRSLHNEAAALLVERLENKIEIDFDTARRLITLILALESAPGPNEDKDEDKGPDTGADKGAGQCKAPVAVKKPASVEKAAVAVLFVCTRNAVRSAMAEAMLKDRVRESRVYVDSAGLDPADVDGFAVAVLREQNLALERHESKDISAIRLSGFSLVITLSDAAKMRVEQMSGGKTGAGNTRIRHLNWDVAEPEINPANREQSLDSYRRVRDRIACLISQNMSLLEA